MAWNDPAIRWVTLDFVFVSMGENWYWSVQSDYNTIEVTLDKLRKHVVKENQVAEVRMSNRFKPLNSLKNLNLTENY